MKEALKERNPWDNDTGRIAKAVWRRERQDSGGVPEGEWGGSPFLIRFCRQDFRRPRYPIFPSEFLSRTDFLRQIHSPLLPTAHIPVHTGTPLWWIQLLHPSADSRRGLLCFSRHCYSQRGILTTSFSQLENAQLSWAVWYEEQKTSPLRSNLPSTLDTFKVLKISIIKSYISFNTDCKSHWKITSAFTKHWTSWYLRVSCRSFSLSLSLSLSVRKMAKDFQMSGSSLSASGKFEVHKNWEESKSERK